MSLPHPTPPHQNSPATFGGMAHEERHLEGGTAEIRLVMGSGHVLVTYITVQTQKFKTQKDPVA